MKKTQIYCNYCDADYIIVDGLEEDRYQVKFCPNCGESLTDSDDIDVVEISVVEIY